MSEKAKTASRRDFLKLAGAGAPVAAVAAVTGGTAPYTYAWDANAANQTTATANQLIPNDYEVVATDKNGCSQTLSITIPSLSTISIDIGFKLRRSKANNKNQSQLS